MTTTRSVIARNAFSCELAWRNPEVNMNNASQVRFSPKNRIFAEKIRQ